MPTRLDQRTIEYAYQARIAELTQACIDVREMVAHELGATHPAVQRLEVVLPPRGLEAMGT